MPDIAHRFAENPLITPADITPSSEGMEIKCVMNPGAFRFNNKTWLIMRVAERPEYSEELVSVPYMNEEDRVNILEFERNDARLKLNDPRYVIYDDTSYLSTLSHLRLVSSSDGVNFTEPEDWPTIIFGAGKLEEFGIEDCRVTELDGTYYLTFTEVSRCGIGVGLIATKDWVHLNRMGMIMPPHNKDCAIFPEKIDDSFYCFHRPSGLTLGGHYLWISNSKNLTHWGNHKCIMRTRPGMWDEERIGAGAAPIRTPEGWLAIYHGANNDHRYCLGALLLDLHDPSVVIARSDEPIMEPSQSYESEGFFGNVVFTNGHVQDGDTINLYYGAADTAICGARLSISEVLSTLR